MSMSGSPLWTAWPSRKCTAVITPVTCEVMVSVYTGVTVPMAFR